MGAAPRVALLAPYFGAWPLWFPAWLHSCAHNPDFDFIIPTDIDPPLHPPNVRFVPTSLFRLRAVATARTRCWVRLTDPRKCCDLRPAYGRIFQPLLRGYEFWGHCDIDVIWGDLGAFVTPEILDENDLVTLRRGRVGGHLAMYRNSRQMNGLFRRHPKWARYFHNPSNKGFDEEPISAMLRSAASDGEIRVHWPAYALGDEEFKTVLRNHPTGWHWERGRLYDARDPGSQIPYLHFLEWKRTMRVCEVSYDEPPEAFDISPDGIRLS